MAGLTAPVTSKILGPDGKPIVTQHPVTFDPEAATDTFYMVLRTEYNLQFKDEDDGPRRSGRIDNVGTP
jgi:hypothetical protein